MLAQVLAIIIFLAMFLLIILEIWERQWITLACGLLTLLLVFGLGMHSMGAIMRTLNLQSFFTTGFFRYQLADDHFYRRHDDHGRRYGKSRFLPLALHGNRKDGKISGYSDLYDVYAAVFRTGYVHRQYHRYPVSGSSYNRTVTASGV